MKGQAVKQAQEGSGSHTAQEGSDSQTGSFLAAENLKRSRN